MFLGNYKNADEWQASQRWEKLESEVKAAMPVQKEFFIGIDLGKSQDATAIVLLEKEKTKDGEIIFVSDISRFEQGTDFVLQAELIERYLSYKPFGFWPTQTIIDASGLGVPVCDVLQSKGVKFRRAVIVAGDSSTLRKGVRYIGRTKLLNGLVTRLGSDNFVLSERVPAMNALKCELASLYPEFNSRGVIYKTDQHDDITIATSLAVFALDKREKNKTGVCALY